VAAESIHQESTRAAGPFVVIDCSAIPRELLESELFGHERGSFTGATQRRTGAFEEAHGGTVFLDEIGELPLQLQPKLLRVLEAREVRRVGATSVTPIDVRVIAATNRDLRGEVNGARFRSDLYFRLAVLKVALPPLRSRPDDLPALVDHFLVQLGAARHTAEALRAPEFQARLAAAAWPGNVRELRNYLERCLVFEEPPPIGEGADAPGSIADLAYEEARRRAVAEFERAYVEALLAKHGGKVALAARAAGIDRVYLYRLMRRHGVRSS
jgi:DNA-binding NtrC family response regulator